MCTDLNQNNTIIIGATNGSGRNTVTKDKKVPPPIGMGDDEAPLGLNGLAAEVLEAGTAPDYSASSPEFLLLIHLLKNRQELIFKNS